jgi:cytochrome c
MNGKISTLALATMLYLSMASDRAAAGELHDAASAGDLEAIKRLLADGVDVDQKGIASPLFLAAREGRVEAVALLIENGAEVDFLSRWGTPLHIAARRGHLEVVRLLLDRGADPTIQGGENQTTPLHEAAEKGSAEIARLLIDRGADPNARNRFLQPPLHSARRRGRDEVAAVLIDAGAAPRAVEPVSDKLALADLEAGRVKAIECTSCHGLEAGKSKTGPTLWDVVGRDRGGLSDYPYSDAMKEAAGAWTYEALNQFLADPSGTIPGTSMELASELDLQARADLIAYLRTLSDTPAPLP